MTQGINQFSISSVIGDYMGGEEDDLPVKQTYAGHYIADHGESDTATNSTTDTSRFLDCTKRTDSVQKAIDLAFDVVSVDRRSTWGLYNGDNRYYRCGIDESALLKTMIQEGYSKGQKVFTILDFGAGNFQWGNSMRLFLTAQEDLPSDITIHIISVRGEKSEHVEEWTPYVPEGVKRPHIKMYDFGSFKVEELISELKKRGLNLEGQVDMIVSRWCFPHLVDPVKTYGQAYNLLRPETGFMLSDGFYFFTNDEEQPAWASLNSQLMRKWNMLQLLVDTKAPLLMRSQDEQIDQFVLRRLDAHPIELEMRFDCLEARENYDTTFNSLGADTVCRYLRPIQDYQDKVKIEYPRPCSAGFHGSKELYDWLKDRNLVSDLSFSGWKPLLHLADDRARQLRDLRMSLQAAANDAVNLAEQADAAYRAKQEEELAKSETERTDSPKTTRNGLGDVMDWLAMGDCVVLCCDGMTKTYFQGPDNASLEDRRVICVNIDPKSNLFDDEWPMFLEGANYKRASSEFRERLEKGPIPHYYSFRFPGKTIYK
jgi:hypothetical protein